MMSDEKKDAKRRRRRSSFFDKTSILLRTSGDSVDDIAMDLDGERPQNGSNNETSKNEEDWKKEYLKCLIDELSEWEKMYSDMKCKRKDAIAKSKHRKYLDKSCLTDEEVQFLTSNRIYRKIIQHMDALKETRAINEKLKHFVIKTEKEVDKYKNEKLKKEKQELLTAALGKPYIDLNTDNCSVDDSAESFLLDETISEINEKIDYNSVFIKNIT